MGEKAIKRKAIMRKVLSCLVVIVFLMSTFSVAVIATNSANSTASNVTLNLNDEANSSEESVALSNNITCLTCRDDLIQINKTETVVNESGNSDLSDASNNTYAKLELEYANTSLPDIISESDEVPDPNLPVINDTDIDTFRATAKTVSSTSSCSYVWIKITDKYCKGYKVYVDGVYQFTEGESGVPDGYCCFKVTPGYHTFKLTLNGKEVSKGWNCQCGVVYNWMSMNDMIPHWCEDGGGDCDNPPTVSFDKSKYYEGDTVHATVSTIHSSVYYKIKDCSGMIRESGYTSNGGSIYYTIPSGASECCYWEICFYWDEENPPLGALGTGGEVTTESYQCSKCYSFYVCPEPTCEVYVKIDDDTCVGYDVYVDGVYKLTEGEGGTPDGYCAFYVTAGTHTIEIWKNGCSASLTHNFLCGHTYTWVSMPDYWCNCNKADLIIHDISWSPSSPELEDTITFTVIVKNIGVGTADPSTVKYYINHQYIDFDNIPSLSHGATSTRTFTWTANSCGNVLVKAIADAHHDVQECDETNNVKQESIEIDGPDLIIQDITWPSGPVCLDNQVTITVKVKNQGECTAGASTVKYYVDNKYVGYDNIPVLGPGSTSTQTFTWTASSCGNVPVKAVADANNDVHECDETNNEKQKSIEIDGPDLIIPDITLPTGPVCLGKPVTITVKVKNQGECTAGASTVKYYVDNKYIGYDSIPVLGHGSTSTQTFTWTASSCGNVPVKAVADANNDVQECYETNNEKQKSIEIDGPDLIIQDITLPTGPVCLGKPVTITVKVKNQGGCTAGASTVKYYINNQYIDFDNSPSLSPGASSTQTFTWTASSCGNVPVKAIADANNNVKECDENNNEKRKSIEVNGPDLIIQNITLPSGNIWLGNTVNIEVTAKNIGKCPAEGPFTVTLYLDSQERSVTVNNLEAGDTNILSFEWTPDTCGIFNIKAAADTGDNVDECDEGNNECTGTVKVVQEIEIYDLSPADSVIISSNDVVFSWKTSVESSAELYIKSEDEGEFTKITGESGLSHVVNITLDRNKNYTWYAKSCGYDKCVESPVRSFYIDNGIVFLQNEYVFNIERDYNQQVKISVKNSDNEPHDLLLSASNPYEDIFLGFVGEGSMDRIITLYPDEVKDIAFVIHTQDAMLENYTISINLTNIGAENITDCAVAHLNVRWPNINFGVEEVSADPLTLLKTVRVINNGDKLTDLSITVAEGLKNKIIMQPSLSHYTLERGVDIKISPSWSEGVGVIQGNLIIEAAGETKELFLDFSCPEGKEIHEVTLEHPLLYYDLKGMWCINCGHVEDTFELPAGVMAENVIFAHIGLHLNAGSSQATSYDVNIGINDHAVGTLSNVIPKGYYEFDIDSSYLNYATTVTATNKYTLDTNMNPGYLTSLSNVRVVICLDELKLYICAKDEAEAYNIAWGLPHIEEQSEDISVEIISPEEGSELEPGETLIKAIVTGDTDGKNLCRVRATFNNSDDEIVLLDDGLHDDGEAGDDVYANTWNAEIGDYEITVNARNCKAEGNDIVHVSVAGEKQLPKALYIWAEPVVKNGEIVDWNPYYLDNPENETLFSFAGAQGVNTLYLATADLDDKNELYASFIQEADDRGIEVHALGGDKTWATNHNDAYDFVNSILKYNKECQNDYQLFDGIHFDIECNDIDIDDYANLLTGIKDRAYERETIASQGMILGIDTRLGWENETVHYTDMLLNTDIDFITVMAYRDTADGIVNEAKDELKAASNHGKSCVIAVETGPSSEPEYVTFYEEGKEALESSLTAVMNKDIVKNEPSFAGLAVHHYVPYKSMYMQAEITKCIMPSRGAYEEGDKVEAEVTVKNTGDLSHRFFVGFSVRDPNGKWWDAPYKSTYLGVGESSIVAVNWTVDSEAPSGSYDALVKVWGFEQFNVTGKKKFHLYDMKDEELKEDMFSVGEPSTEFQIGMFVNPHDHYITTVKEGEHRLPNDLSFESGDYVELLTKLQGNGIMRIFVNTYEARVGNEKHVFYPEENGSLDLVDLKTKGVYNLSTLLTEAHDLNIEVHACVACFGPDSVDPTGCSGLNQEIALIEVVDYLLSNYKDSKGRGLDGIHLDFVRFVKPYNAKGDASNISIMSAFINDLKEVVVKNRAKLSASVMAADHHDSKKHLLGDDCPTDRNCWAGAYDPVKNTNGQDYTKMSENLDFISPMAYHYSKWYNKDSDYVGSVTKFVKEKADNNCDVIPDIQGYCEWHCNKWTGRCGEPSEFCEDEDCIEYVKHEEPGFVQIYNALNSAKRNGAKGANIFRYTHLSDDEWLAIWCYLDDHDQLISASINCSANLHAYDSQGRHVGVSATGGIDLEIPDAYYTGPDSEPERIIIPDQSDNIIFKVDALDAGEFDFTLMHSTNTKTTTLTYSNVSIIQTTEATVDVSEANPNYLMEIDYDGDGTTDYTIEPDSIDTDGQDSYSIQLHTGWNLISLPIMPDDSGVLDVMNSVDGNWNSVWSYETGNWKRYDLTAPVFLNDLTTIEPGKGYWIHMKSEDTLYVSGSEPMVKSIPLSAGWNLVGYNSLSSKPTTDAMNSVAGNWNSVWSYEGGNWKRYDLTGPGFLNDLTIMEPGKGYWINMKSPDTWTLGA